MIGGCARVALAAALVGWSGCADRAQRPSGGSSRAAGAVVILSAALHGSLAPCGCSQNMRGGVDRVAAQVLSVRREGLPVVYVDAGDSLFGAPKLFPAEVPQQERKARALAEAFRRMGLAAHGVGELDLVRGRRFLDDLKLDDLVDGEPRLVKAGERHIRFVAAPSGTALWEGASRAKRAGADFVIGLLHQPMEEAQRVAQDAAGRVDLILSSHARPGLPTEENRLLRGEVPVVQLQDRGRTLLRVDLSYGGPRGAPFVPLRGQADLDRELHSLEARIELLRKQVNEPGLSGEALSLRQQKLEELLRRAEQVRKDQPPPPMDRNGFTLRFIPIEATLPSAPEVKQVLLDYDRDVGRLNVAWAKEHGEDCRTPTEQEPGMVGSARCRECHEEAFPAWLASKHARAYSTLQKLEKQFHLDCVRCHVTGWQRPGGVCRVDRVSGRAEVGCESCHGPGSQHAEDPSASNIVRGNRPEACLGCHDPENSPDFDFARYRRQILGPGHGEPAGRR